MADSIIRYGIIGGREADLAVLSALHNQDRAEVVYVYDQDRTAVGIEIAEILGIRRFHTAEQLATAPVVDRVVVGEPRAKFAAEVELLGGTGCKFLNPSEALTGTAREEAEEVSTRGATPAGPTIDDTFVALERLFDRKELLKFLLEVAAQSTSSSAGSIMLYSQETRDLSVAFAVGLSERTIKKTRQALGKGIAGRVAQTRRAMLIRGDAGDAHYHDERERVDIGSAICAPLLWGERLLGVLNVSVTRRDRQHDERDLETLKTLSRRISRILFQSLKLDELQVHHQEWRFRSTMGEIAVKPISTQEKFSVLSKYLSELIGAETVEIYLNTAEGDWFVLGGSNRLLSPTDSRVRIQRGALSRSFLDNRTIVLTEGSQSSAEPLDGISSAVFCPLGMGRLLGVLAFEFSQQYKLDEFMLVKDSIVHEISRFLTSETRERKLNREVRALRMISDGAPAILGCRSIKSLADALASAAAVVLECDHVSVRLAENLGSDGYIESYFGVPNDILLEWRKGDQERFDSLERERKARSTAFLTFDPRVRETGSASDDETSAYRSALVFPIMSNDGFIGGIMAYDKNSDDPLEDAIFSDLDRKTLEHLVDLAKPVLESILRRRPLADARDSAPIEAVTAESLDRLKEMCDAEISRSDRYHNTFTLVLLRVELINTLLDTDRKRGLTLIEEMSQGLKTRTRKTDFGVWIKPDTYAILTLDGGRRIRFLISRAVMYLEKDLSTITGFPPEAKRVSVGVADYPGKAKSGDEMLAEAEKSLKPYQQE